MPKFENAVVKRPDASRLYNPRIGLQLCAMLVALLWSYSSVAIAGITQVSNSELKVLMNQGVPLIDVRRPDEWKNTGVVEGSHLLTFFDAKGKYDVKQWLSELEKIAPDDQPFILICEVGGRTGSISRLLDRRLGYSGVHNVTKGIRAWIKAGEPTVPWSP